MSLNQQCSSFTRDEINLSSLDTIFPTKEEVLDLKSLMLKHLGSKWIPVTTYDVTTRSVVTDSVELVSSYVAKVGIVERC
jgi:hypothetical protein